VPVLTVPVGGTAPFAITFDPVALGNVSTNVRINSNDPNQDPYIFAIEGNGTATPEINVRGNGVDIADGDTTPDLADFTNFGGVATSGSSRSRDFTVQNTGGVALNITNVSIGGSHAADFSITADPTGPIASAGSDTLTINFDPSADGVRSATVTITSDDADEGSYTFDIQGTGSSFTVAAPTPVTVTTPAENTLDIAWDHPGLGTVPVVLFDEDFSADSGGFSFVDESSHVPQFLNSAHQQEQLKIFLGNDVQQTVNNVRGYWAKSFNLATAQTITVSFNYVITDGIDAENNERAALLVDVDSVDETEVDFIVGDGSDGTSNSKSGFFQKSFTLAAGPHTLKFIGTLNTKNYPNETFTVAIEDVQVNGVSFADTLPDEFDLERATSSGGPWSYVDTISEPTRTYQENSLTCETTYYYRLKARDVGSGSESEYSPVASGVTQVCPTLATPVNLVVTTPFTENALQLDWAQPALGSFPGTLLSASFDTGADGFTFADETSGGALPAYVEGTSDSGNLTMHLGDPAGGTPRALRAAWSNSFTIDSAQTVTITFDYRLVDGRDAESSETLTFNLQVGSDPEQTVDTISGNDNNGVSTPKSGTFEQTYDLAAGTYPIKLIGMLSDTTAGNEDFYLEVDTWLSVAYSSATGCRNDMRSAAPPTG
jgi:hypothetical protein